MKAKFIYSEAWPFLAVFPVRNCWLVATNSLNRLAIKVAFFFENFLFDKVAEMLEYSSEFDDRLKARVGSKKGMERWSRSNVVLM